MSDTKKSDAKRALEDRRKNVYAARKRQNGNKLRIAIVAGLLAVIALLAAITAVYVNGRAPGKVESLSAEPCYSQLALKWTETPGADGYYIYASKDGQTEKIGEVESGDKCSFIYKDYDRDSEYKITVTGYSENAFTHHHNEGDPSSELTVNYDYDSYAQKIPVITYHKIVPAGTEFTSSLLVAEDTFDEHMKYLHDNGYTTLTPDEFYEWHRGRKEFPKKSVMVTFDDGFYGTYHLAYPIIKKYSQAATVFCIGKNTEETTADFDPQDRKDHYIGRDVIEGMRKEYPRFSFESHTYAMHSRVNGRKPASVFSYEQVVDDCKQNESFGFRYLAYPWGAHNKTVRKAVKDSGYKMAFCYRPFYYALRSDRTYAVNRIKINGTISMDGFIEIVSGERDDYNNPDAPENN